MGNAYGHVAIGVRDIVAVCDAVRRAEHILGCSVTRNPGNVIGGNDYIAFITDPDRYKIELIQVRI
jgi:lactoylglutathione lyase